MSARTSRLARLVVVALVVIVAVGVGLSVVAAYAGLLVSYHLSITYGVRLAAGPTVVLALSAGFLILAVAHRARRWQAPMRSVPRWMVRRMPHEVARPSQAGAEPASSHQPVRGGVR